MKKFFLAILLSVIYNSNIFCQYFGPAKEDSVRFSDLRSKLSATQGKEKVDLLNELSWMSQFFGTGWDTVKMRVKYDSIRYYGSQAYELASKIGYSDGIAMALINLNHHSSPESIYQVPLKDRDTRERNIRQAIAMAEKTKNYWVLGQAYGALGTLTTGFEPNSKWIEQFNKREYYFKLAKDSEALADIYVWATGDFSSEGNYEKAFEYGDKAIEYLKYEDVRLVNWHRDLVVYNTGVMSDLHSSIGDYETALKYLKSGKEYSLKNGGDWTFNQNLARVFCDMHQYDSAMIYWKLWRETEPTYESAADGSKAFGYAILADIQIANRQYDSAIAISRDNILKYRKFNNQWGVAGEMNRIGKAYYGKGDYDSALYFTRAALVDLEKFNNRPSMMEGYQTLASAYHQRNDNDSAYKYLVKYNEIKDSISNRQLLLRLFKQKLDASNQQAKTSLSLLSKDNSLKTAQLKQEAQQKNFLLILVAALALTGIFVYRVISLKRKNERLRLENELTVQRLESEKKQSELKRQASDLQMQALRSQMNPHFIFNSLSSINWFIMENDKDTASDYLTRFSRLMRMVLNAQKPMIPLEDELKMLQLYLDMERLRFNNSFDYSIAFTNNIDAGTVSIPPMLLQPFCENAIWHGLMNKEGQGHLVINIHSEESMLECIITDDGVGRKQAAILKNRSPKKERSLGLEITRERLALFSEENNAEAKFVVEDLEDENGMSTGTKVILKLAYKNYIEKVA